MSSSSSPSDTRRGRALELLLLVVAFVVVNLVSAAFQEPISLRNGRGADGSTYCRVAEQLARDQSPTGRAPFVYRVGVPLLASIPLRQDVDVITAFKIVNLIGNALSSVLLILWLRLYVTDWRIRTILALLFMTQWHAPVRYVHFYSTLIDAWVLVILLSGLILIHRLRTAPSWIGVAAFAVVLAVGVLVREAALLLGLALLFAGNPITVDSRSALGFRIARWPRWSFFLPFVFGIAALLLVRSMVLQTNPYSFVQTAMRFAYEKPALTYVHAWFIAFGPVLVLAIYNWRRGLALLSSHQFLFAFLAGTGAAAWVGGTDTERFLYWTMPVIYVLVGRAIEDHREALRSWALLVVLGLSQAISQRLFWAIPDLPSPKIHEFPVLTPMSSEVAYKDLLSFHGARWVEAISLAEYLVLALVLLVWLRRHQLSSSRGRMEV